MRVVMIVSVRVALHEQQGLPVEQRGAIHQCLEPQGKDVAKAPPSGSAAVAANAHIKIAINRGIGFIIPLSPCGSRPT
ncbi:MAG TPA: hypothetical protein DCS43_03410 [Verrucomicrobia bacterium]|nr:hypothetical protein [Verrucomicrobiota bacterium]